MIIQFVLVAILLVVFFFAILRKTHAPLVAMAMMGLSCAGIVCVIFPSIAQNLADTVGVSRGVDLVVYVFMAMMMVVILDLYLRWQSSLEALASVVRHISIQEVLPPEECDKKRAEK